MRNKFIIISLLIAFILPVAGCQSRGAVAGVNSVTSQAENNQPAVLSLTQQESQYEIAVKEILATYWQSQDISGVKDKILALRAPVKYTDLHLSLVLAFESIEQGKKISDQSKINSGADKLNQLKVQYSWLQ